MSRAGDLLKGIGEKLDGESSPYELESAWSKLQAVKAQLQQFHSANENAMGVAEMALVQVTDAMDTLAGWIGYTSKVYDR